ncbi:MAG: excinuclease ABC subunit UvrC [Eubacteriaceae bacterium]|nr:excinuclease ABC subunit UvrC [Eubacteriaceae bacterium]
MTPTLEEKLKKLPDSPGIYMHKDSRGKIIYVGKAKNLKNRVRQYFAPKLTDTKTKSLVSNIADTDWVVVDNETEAFLLERDLIREHNPYYNIRLKDDKSYPYIKLSLQEPYPRVSVTRRHLPDGGKYFGPYPNAAAARLVTEAINRYYPLRMCNKTIIPGKTVGKVCLNFHIGQCCGACRGNIGEQEYDKWVKEVLSVLSGKYESLYFDIRRDMLKEADKLNFEDAAHLKEMSEAFSEVFVRQKIAGGDSGDRDIIALSSDSLISCVVLFRVREGRVTDTVTRYMNKSAVDADSEVLSSFVRQFYSSGVMIPREIVLSEEIDQAEGIAAMLSHIRGGKVFFTLPKIGDKKKLTDLAMKNAVMNIENRRSAAEARREKTRLALKELGEVLGAAGEIDRIEACDISNISGADNVGVTVVFTGGKKSSKDYRRYRIQSVDGANDYAAMAEVVFRRLTRAAKEIAENEPNPKFLPLPRIIFADGGATHVAAIKGIIEDFGYDIVTAGLVKDSKHKLRGLVNSFGEEISLSELKYSRTLLNEISEEVHRYAIEYHRLSRSKSMLTGELKGIKGIGQKRADALMRHFGSLEAIAAADAEAIAKVEGMTKAAGEKVAEYFKAH